MASRTTTTVIRTTQGTGGSRRPRTRARPRTRSTAKRSTTSRRTTTSTQREQYKADANKTNYLPLLGLLGLLGIGGFFFLKSREAQAATGPGGAPGGPGGNGGQPGTPGAPGVPGITPPPGVSPGTSPGGHVHPPPGTPATVAVTTGQTSLNLRGAASPTANLITTLPNGTPITVVQSNLLEQGLANADTANNRWWQVSANGQTGFVRAIGPDGIWNVSFAGRVGTGHLLRAGTYRPAVRPFAAVAYAPAMDPFQALVSAAPHRRW